MFIYKFPPQKDNDQAKWINISIFFVYKETKNVL